MEWRRDVPFAKWSRILDQKGGERKRKREEKGGSSKGLYRNVQVRPHREERESTTVGRTSAARVNLRFLGVGRRERGSILCLTDSFPQLQQSIMAGTRIRIGFSATRLSCEPRIEYIFFPPHPVQVTRAEFISPLVPFLSFLAEFIRFHSVLFFDDV